MSGFYAVVRIGGVLHRIELCGVDSAGAPLPSRKVLRFHTVADAETAARACLPDMSADEQARIIGALRVKGGAS